MRPLLLALCAAVAWTADAIDVDAVFRVAARKAAAHDAAHPRRDAFPTDARGPRWKTVSYQDWVSGFYPGMLWYITEHARRAGWPDAAAWQTRAAAWTAPLTPLRDVTNTHDLGFMVFDSAGHGLRLTCDGKNSTQFVTTQPIANMDTQDWLDFIL